MEKPLGVIVISVPLPYISINLNALNVLNGVIQDEHLNNRCGEASSTRYAEVVNQDSQME